MARARAILAGAGAVACLVLLARWEWRSPPIVLADGGTVLAVDRGAQLLRCPAVWWRVPPGAAATVLGQPVPAEGTRRVCAEAAVVLEMGPAPGVPARQYRVAIFVVARRAGGLAALLGLPVLAYLAGWQAGLMAGPGAFGRSIRRSAGRLKARVGRWLRTEDRRHLATLGGLLVLGLALRLAYLQQPVRLDETGTLLMYGNPDVSLADAVSGYQSPNNHLLNTVAMQATTRLFGSIDPWVFRLPAFVAGVLVPPLAYLVARLHHGRPAGLLAAGLTAVSSPLILYSTNARGYAMQAAAALLLFVLAHGLRRAGRPAGWLAWGMTVVLATVALPSSVWVAAVVFVWLLASILVERRGPARARGAADLLVTTAFAGYASFLAYLPIITRNGLAAISGSPWYHPLGLAEFLATLPARLAAVLASWQDGMPAVTAAILAAGLLVALAVPGRVGRARVPAAPVTVITLAGLWLATTPHLRYPRLVLFLLPLALVTASGGIGALAGAVVPGPGRSLLLGLLAPALALGGAASVLAGDSVARAPDTYLFREARQLHRDLQARYESGDVVVSWPEEAVMVLRYYQRQDGSATPVYLLALGGDLSRRISGLAQRIYLVAEADATPDPDPARLLAHLMGPEAGQRFGRPAVVAVYERHTLYMFRRGAGPDRS